MREEGERANSAETGGIWSLDGDVLTCLAPSGAGPATVLVPSEHVFLTAVDLPLPTRRQRLSALPFAIEDAIADPIGAVHVALGEELSPRRHLAAAVRHEIMADWTARVTAAGLADCTLVPDALSLPIPDEGSWSTQRAGERVLVRTPDGAGFATPLGQLAMMRGVAGDPVCIALGELLPPEIVSVPAAIDLEPLTTRLMVPALDLRQGLYSKPRRPIPLSARKIMAIVAAGALTHGCIAVADTVAMQRIADDRRAEAQQLVERYLPGVTVDGDFAAEVNELLAGGGGPARSSFFPLLVKASAALGQPQAGAALRGLSYQAGTGELSLQIEQPDLVTLQRTEGALANSGLNIVSGAVSVQNNSAATGIVVRDPASGVR
jgi:general secretion pathway protein L